jgi:hypothetical protein
MKIAIPSAKPRNPLVAPSLSRRAGAHRRSAGGQRRRAEQSVRAELRQDPDPPGR